MEEMLIRYFNEGEGHNQVCKHACYVWFNNKDERGDFLCALGGHSTILKYLAEVIIYLFNFRIQWAGFNSLVLKQEMVVTRMT